MLGFTDESTGSNQNWKSAENNSTVEFETNKLKVACDALDDLGETH